ncbi:hypothetical protein DYB37_004311 [Aphanomyces astaci]|uniref:Major facilitator superfamily (MFS) profile domain-containing protein n=2 Tax=Aphanomyces astaci TaxID=112090 RepID=A0A3R6YL86_APHAT|nr:hypothetical protein DYB35_004151 [Aphanomyces astaci]RHZ18001.1 hypothetical protein DYB37_004311 [Aphanomyces astaci]
MTSPAQPLPAHSFGPFYTTLVGSGQWHEKCSEGTTDAVCPTQEVFLQVVFSTSFLFLSAANVIFGLCIDIVGPRVAAITGVLIATVGNICVAYGDSTAYDGIGIIAGYGLIGMGGMGLFLSSFQVINLFENQGIPCSIMSSLFNLSGIKPTLLLDGLKHALRSGDLWHFAFYFGWLSLVFSFTGGAIPSIIRRTAVDADAADVYTNFLFPIVSNSTFLFAPLVGYCIERFGFHQVFAGCLFLTQLFLATLFVPVLEVQLLGFVFCSMAQASLYTLHVRAKVMGYVVMCYPSRLYGTLQAFVTLFSFTIGSLTYVINPLAQQYFGGDYTLILTFLAFPTLCLYGFQHFIREEAEEDKATLPYDEPMTPQHQ